MRWRRLIWLLVSGMVVTLTWQWSQNGAQLRLRPGRELKSPSAVAAPFTPTPISNSTPPRAPRPVVPARLAFRLSNTSKPLVELLRSDRAILLENALLDTDSPVALPIPEEFRRKSEPGSYIVQARGVLDAAFRASIERAGAKVVSYIPNNAYLIRATESAAQSLSANPQTQAVLPYEPYYKLKLSLLETAASTSAGTPLALNLLMFSDSTDASVELLRSYGAAILSEESSPFGRMLSIRVAREHLGSLAAMPEVAALELSHPRVTANDLSRATIGVAADSVTSINYLGLTGTDVMVNVNDTGVDATQPELSGRVLFDTPASGSDTNGHGTHVAGIIGSSGTKSITVTDAPGSRLPPVSYQFRGQAPGAMLFAIATGLEPGPAQSDAYLQQTAAQTESFISNNSWYYTADNEYDLAAASYDAAVRDALPGLPGSQPLLYVFAAGNVGQGKDDGSGGGADTIQSPATGKNVITVGALEQLRFITNQTWTCGSGAGGGGCVTNTPWLALTDSSNEVAAFSSRGNVGIGIEGESGRLKPDLVAPGTFILSTRSTQWDQSAYYSGTNTFLDHSPDTNYSPVLSNLNQSAGPYYRFESGTSLAAAEVSGTLALMQEFFERRLGRTNSPALMKALLINGARSLGANYGTVPASTTNLQGWGLIHLPNSLPGSLSNISSSANSMLLFDQSPADSLATGQSHTRYLTLSAAAANLPLRATLVWTDPPGNPIAGVKLVNDLDLLVTNLDTGEVFWGNDIPPGSDFNRPWDPGSNPNSDRINNVENVFLAPLGGSHYSITVVGRRVNVNAVSALTEGVVQDYALVISSDNGEIVDALTVTDNPIASTSWSAITFLTNTFNTSAGDAGAMILKERVGAGSALLSTNTIPLGGNPATMLTLGTANQWHFYVCRNDAGFTNAAFLTFLTPSLATAPETFLSRTNAARLEADIDLYISTNPGLTNLDPQVIASADASLSRVGAEMILYSNAIPGPYYIGVKCESGEGAEYGLLTVFSQEPFFQNDGLGNDLLRGFPTPTAIPTGTPGLPGSAYLICVNPDWSLVRRVVATNTLTVAAMNDLVGTLTHNYTAATLNNHSPNSPATGQTFIYDDSDEGDFPGSQNTDGPGSLQDFAGQLGFGQWLLTVASTNQAGSDDNYGLFIENQPDLTAGISVDLLPGACRQDFLFVPAGVSNLTAFANLASGGPLSWQIYPADALGSNCPSLFLPVAPTNASIVIDATSRPPINPGLYISRLCNFGTGSANVNLSAALTFAPTPPSLVQIASSAPMPIADDAISLSTIEVTNTEEVLSTEVGIRIDRPRISDLAISLISPQGTRVLLDENRGGASSEGMGANALVTNVTPVSSTGGPQASTNVLETGQTSGTLAINYDFLALPDDMRIYYQGQLLYDSGLVSFTGATNINYGPGDSTLVTIIMNEGGNFDTNTAWFYTVTSTHPVPIYFTFTENTNLTTTPIKFAPVPFTNLTYTVPGIVSSNGIYYLPEESLDRLVGQSAVGQWTLEIRDSRAGPNSSPPPRLVSWQLSFLLENDVPTPVPLVHDQPSTNLLGPGQIQWFSVNPPSWLSFVTNALVSASLPVNIWFNANTPPTGTNSGDVPLLLGTSGGSYTLQTNAIPPLLPGASYFLGIQNTNAATVQVVFEVTFDVTNVTTLQSGVPYSAMNPGPVNAMDYYRYVATTNAIRAQFEINGPSTNMLLLARKGRLPALGRYDYISANPGTNDQLISIYNYSSPVALTAGEWFLAAVNLASGPASYSILATEFPDYGTNLVLMNPVPGSTSVCFSWNSLAGIHYFVQAKTNLTDAQWTTVSPTLTAVDVLTTYCTPLPSPFQFFRVGEGLVVSPQLKD